MSARDGHEQYEELAAGHALSALEPADEQLLLAHLPSCARCRRSLAEHRETLAELAYAAPPVEPPAALLAGILGAIGRTATEGGSVAQESPEVADRQPPVDLRARRDRAAPAPAADLAAGPPDELAAARARRAQRRAPAWAAVAAALALVLGLGGWNLALHQQAQQQSTQAARLQRAVQALGGAPARTVPLRDDAGAMAAIAVMNADSSMTIVVDGLAPNDTRRDTYVLWAVDGIRPRPVTTFDVRGSGVQVLPHAATESELGPVPDAFAVTREDGRAAPPQPRHPILAQGLTA